jgi:hypothetical protein
MCGETDDWNGAHPVAQLLEACTRGRDQRGRARRLFTRRQPQFAGLHLRHEGFVC